MGTKKETKSTDAKPSILYAKKAAGDGEAIPVLVDADGRVLTAQQGFGPEDNLTITDVTVGVINTITTSNGTKTKTAVINNTTNVTTITWS